MLAIGDVFSAPVVVCPHAFYPSVWFLVYPPSAPLISDLCLCNIARYIPALQATCITQGLEIGLNHNCSESRFRPSLNSPDFRASCKWWPIPHLSACSSGKSDQVRATPKDEHEARSLRQVASRHPRAQVIYIYFWGGVFCVLWLRWEDDETLSVRTASIRKGGSTVSSYDIGYYCLCCRKGPCLRG